MKDALGVLFSVIIIAIVLGSITNISINAKKKEIELTNIKALNEIKNHCNYLCKSNVGTIMPLEVKMYPGIYIYTNDQKICFKKKEEIKCEICDCKLEEYSLNLTTDFLLDYMGKHEYLCDFLRIKEGISLDCQG